MIIKGSAGLMDKGSESQPWYHGFEPHMGHDHHFGVIRHQYWLVPGSGLKSNLNKF